MYPQHQPSENFSKLKRRNVVRNFTFWPLSQLVTLYFRQQDYPLLFWPCCRSKTKVDSFKLTWLSLHHPCPFDTGGFLFSENLFTKLLAKRGSRDRSEDFRDDLYLLFYPLRNCPKNRYDLSIGLKHRVPSVSGDSWDTVRGVLSRTHLVLRKRRMTVRKDVEL